MREQVSSHHVPAKYRIGLALSAAFLIHTLIFSGLPSPIEDTPKPQHSIQFELVFPGSTASVQATSEATRETPENRNPTFEIPPTPIPETPSPPVTTRSSGQKVPDKKAPPVQPTRPASPTHKATPRDAAPAGSQVIRPAGRAKDRLTQITPSPSNDDPYITKLAGILGKEVQKTGVPAIRQLSREVVIRIELQLLGNGTLTRARIMESSGIERVDVAVYEAALAASPYPGVPEKNKQNRFVVELRLYPKRL